MIYKAIDDGIPVLKIDAIHNETQQQEHAIPASNDFDESDNVHHDRESLPCVQAVIAVLDNGAHAPPSLHELIEAQQPNRECQEAIKTIG